MNQHRDCNRTRHRTLLSLFIGAWLISQVSCAVGQSGGPPGGENAQTSNALTKLKRILTILPPPGNPHNIIVKRVDDTLNLTCLIEFQGTSNSDNKSMNGANDPMYKLSWYVPTAPQNSKQRMQFTDDQSDHYLTITVVNLKESDSGDYKCEATALKDGALENVDSGTVKVLVKPRKSSCGESNFFCSSGECISRYYTCDGRKDCKDGADESISLCGSPNPCDGKLRCDDGRCISKIWCCDRSDPSCNYTAPLCCKNLFSGPFGFENPYHTPQSHQLSDMGFLQTTIYTVIGCAMAFMFIITIMVIAICRVHLKRTSLPRYPHHLNQASQRHDSWGNIFLHYSGTGGMPCPSATSGLLVTYNINNGVQFVGRPANPPPYSEIVRAPPKEGPPPPYASEENIALSPSSSSSRHDNIVPGTSSTVSPGTSQPPSRIYTIHGDPDLAAQQALLADNNNGDINGNSTMEVQVEPNSNLTAPTRVVTEPQH